MTGCTYFLAKVATYCEYKLQISVAASVTEAEFIAAATSAKTAKYLRSILTNLGIPQLGSTTTHVDNIAAAHMANHSQPTPRTCHIDISWFALQIWVK